MAPLPCGDPHTWETLQGVERGGVEKSTRNTSHPDSRISAVGKTFTVEIGLESNPLYLELLSALAGILPPQKDANKKRSVDASGLTALPMLIPSLRPNPKP